MHLFKMNIKVNFFLLNQVPGPLLVVLLLPLLVGEVGTVARKPQLLGVRLGPEVVEPPATDAGQEDGDEDDFEGVRGDDEAPSA